MPLYRTMATYSVLWSIADAVEQKFISKKQNHNIEKTLRIAGVGTFVIAPLVYNWVKLAERLYPGKKIKTVVTKVLLEQVLFAPSSITCFYAATCFLERKSFREEMKKKFFVTWRTGLCFWPFIQIVNFGFVTPMYRPLVVAGGSFVWSIFLCFMKEEPKKENMCLEINVTKESQNTKKS